MNPRNFIATIFAAMRRKISLREQRQNRSPVESNDTWHSWDLHPRKHPWLTTSNLQEMKQFSTTFIEHEKKMLRDVDPRNLKIGFVGNIANCMYVRSSAFREVGFSIDLFLHPQDRYIMSQPCWEEFDGTLPPGVHSIDDCNEQGIRLPDVDSVYQFDEDHDWREKLKAGEASFIRPSDVDDFPSYLSNLPTLQALQKMDVLWGTQNAYLGYLANKPYVVSQSGADIWLEASRGDELGRVQRKAFASARIFLISNPWSFAHARRFGFDHLVYLPKVLNEKVYCPGYSETRMQWAQESGGNFFVLTSSRQDEIIKGSSIGIRGFAEFAKTHPGARLVMIGWGKDIEQSFAPLDELGIRDKLILLPISGKKRLREFLKSADVFMDQFVLGYYGSAGMEAMACGLPVIGRVEIEQYEALCETGAPPIHNVNSIEGVANALTLLANDNEVLCTSSKAHRDWFVLNHGAEYWHDAYTAVLAATSAGLSTDFSASPLTLPLSQEENEYHASGLAHAPIYPSYGR